MLTSYLATIIWKDSYMLLCPVCDQYFLPVIISSPGSQTVQISPTPGQVETLNRAEPTEVSL